MGRSDDKKKHKLVGLHDTVGSVRPRRDPQAVQYSLSYNIWAKQVKGQAGFRPEHSIVYHVSVVG
jgi:hypothetical protein